MAYCECCLRHWASLTLSSCVVVKNSVQLRKQWCGRNVDEMKGESTRHAINEQVNIDTVRDKGKRQEMKLPKSLKSAIDMRLLGSGGYGASRADPCCCISQRLSARRILFANRNSSCGHLASSSYFSLIVAPA